MFPIFCSQVTCVTRVKGTSDRPQMTCPSSGFGDLSVGFRGSEIVQKVGSVDGSLPALAVGFLSRVHRMTSGGVPKEGVAF